MIASQPQAKLWKNQRVIDKNGLIIPQNIQRLFQDAECTILLENILQIYQKECKLKSHYLHFNMNPSAQNETITYKAYVNYKCAKRDRKDGKNRVIGELMIIYSIKRMDPSKARCHYNFLILFDIKCNEIQCAQCGQPHVSRINESSFYVIRTQFVYEMMKKLSFMIKEPTYPFTPHNFICNAKYGQTPYEHVKDHNYEPSYYFQRCEQMLVDSLRFEMLKRGMDCEAMRLDQLPMELKPSLLYHSALFKLKYMCRKCQGKEIWTSRDYVYSYYCVLKLHPHFEMIGNQLTKLGKVQVYDESPVRQKYLKILEELKLKQENQINPEDKPDIQTLFKTDRRRLDRSVKRQTDEHQEFEKDFKSIGRWHRKLQDYKMPYLILYSIKVPKMPCRRCAKEKDGLIYITNLVDEAHSIINRKVISKILEQNKTTTDLL